MYSQPTHLSVLRVLTLSALAASATGALAQTTASPADIIERQDGKLEPYTLEAYPKHIARKLRAYYRKTDALRTGLRGLYSSLDIWPYKTERLVVCFFGGDRQQRRLVVNAVRPWLQADAHIPLDFGPSPTYRSCKDVMAHIRISFEPGSIWSLIGQQSIKVANQSEASMNLGYSKYTTNSRVRRMVLHEFGHALGLEHEHQHPFTDCWRGNYKKKDLLTYLKAQRGWSLREAEAELKVIRRRGTMATEPDKKSIMHYTFPARFYVNGRKNPCYAEAAFQLSGGDKKLIRGIYPPRAATRATHQRTRRKLLLERLAELRKKKLAGFRKGGNPIDLARLATTLDELVPAVSD